MTNNRHAYEIRLRALIENGASLKQAIRAMSHQEHHFDATRCEKMYEKILADISQLPNTNAEVREVKRR